MKTYILLFAVLIVPAFNLMAQRCGTMENLELMKKNDPALESRMQMIDKKTQEWIQKNNRGFKTTPNPSVINKPKNKGPVVQSLCPYNNNAYLATISAPTVLNQSVSPSPNCVYGGEYVIVTGLVAGNVYRISTCGANNFDTQLTIYTAGGSIDVAHNDDWCGTQSEIYFTPEVSGDYDILVNEFNCQSNTLCAELEVELWYEPRPVITIPVVVHVVHYGEPVGTGRNLSVAEIQSQIQVLNEDFRRLNADFISTPSAFGGASTDPLIEFCLAQQDEFGNPTTGIVRYLGSQPDYSMSDMDITWKPSTIWDRDYYLNFWTVDLQGTTLGYAQFPGGPASTDGIVISYKYFGMISSTPPYDLGRTTTHEVGHWLNLMHIWGNENACSSDDQVSDTPLQGTKSFGCFSFPFTDACSPNYPGIMFYNYMDYSDDACLTMFTYGQSARMDAALFNDRSTLLSSQGCSPSTTGISEIQSSGIRVFPNPANGITYITSREIIEKIEVINSLGEKVYSAKASSGHESIDLSLLTPGIYTISISSCNSTAFQKLIICK